MEVFSKYSSLKSIHFSIYFIIIFEFMYLHNIIEGENINQSISYEIKYKHTIQNGTVCFFHK